jgi:hypothetical protein
MRTTVELPDAIYRRAEQAAQARGLSVDEIISGALERELGEPVLPSLTGKRVEFPLIRSKNPGTVDLSDFDFDDLLA